MDLQSLLLVERRLSTERFASKIVLHLQQSFVIIVQSAMRGEQDHLQPRGTRNRTTLAEPTGAPTVMLALSPSTMLHADESRCRMRDAVAAQCAVSKRSFLYKPIEQGKSQNVRQSLSTWHGLAEMRWIRELAGRSR